MKGNAIDSAKENHQSYCKIQMKTLLHAVAASSKWNTEELSPVKCSSMPCEINVKTLILLSLSVDNKETKKPEGMEKHSFMSSNEVFFYFYDQWLGPGCPIDAAICKAGSRLHFLTFWVTGRSWKSWRTSGCLWLPGKDSSDSLWLVTNSGLVSSTDWSNYPRILKTLSQKKLSRVWLSRSGVTGMAGAYHWCWCRCLQELGMGGDFVHQCAVRKGQKMFQRWTWLQKPQGMWKLGTALATDTM